MGLFDFFKKNGAENGLLNTTIETTNGEKPKIENGISRELFIEDRDPSQVKGFDLLNGQLNGIESIYLFLQADYETRGYQDALSNPDDSYKTDNIKLIKHDLQILIQKVNTYYSDLISDLSLHIETRGRAGLIDLVKELESRKEMVNDHIGKVNQIKNEMETESGMSNRIILSYQRGFMRGLAALTYSKVLNREL